MTTTVRLLLALSLALPACEKKTDEVPRLEQEAITLAKYNQPRLDRVKKRMDLIFERGRSIGKDAVGLPEAAKQLGEARDKWVELEGIVGPGVGGKSALETQAAAAAKTGKPEELEKLIDDTRTKLDEGFLVINDDLAGVEAFLAQNDARSGAGSSK